MVMATRGRVVGLMLLGGGMVACGRTHLSPSRSDAASGNPPSHPSPDAALITDVASLSRPDLAPSLRLDLVPDFLRKPRCGDGWLDPGEKCDDSNTVDCDGCDSRCRIETDWAPCPWPFLTVCGDGRLSPNESCDDGNVDKGDGCSDVCGIEPGFRCVIPGKRCAPICGDRMMVGLETCDDGNATGGDGCSEICVTENCWDCSSGACLPRPGGADGGNCQDLPVASCGNGHIEGSEECDEGAENNDDSYGGCSTHCQHIGCGDGVTSGPEECDLGMAGNRSVYGDANGCTRICTIPHYCGDGIVDSDRGEGCDLGALNGQSICTQRCTGLIL